MDVTQPPQQLHSYAAMAESSVVTERSLVDISPDASDHFNMRPLVHVNEDRDNYSFDAAASRVRMLHFNIEYRQNNVTINLQDINCVGEYAVICN